MFGMKTPANTAQTPAPSDQECIFDVTAADFEASVLTASMETPVIVDFWAPWCGPCKQLMPILENAVNAANGAIKLAKVNLDDNPELAQALQVQSVPTVFAFINGQPVEAFQGAQPASTVQAFIDKVIQASRAGRPDAIDIPETLKAAGLALSQNDLATAQNLYAHILQQDEKNASAYAGMIRTFIAGEALDQAQALLDGAAESIANDPDMQAAKTALDIAKNKPDNAALASLEQKANQNPDDIDTKCALAEVQFAHGKKEQAIDTLLEAITKDREWNDQEARKNLLRFFEAMGNADPLTIQGRKKLSRILFS